MNGRYRLPLLIALGLLLLSLGVTSFPGGYGFFDAPSADIELALPDATSAPAPAPSKSAPTPAEKFCNGRPGNPITYYANDSSTAKHNFGPSLDPNLTLDVRQVVEEEKERLCHDPALADATAAAAFPDWYVTNGLAFVWGNQIDKLDSMHWNRAELKYHDGTPTFQTMMMIAGKSANARPTVYITPANDAGWYLHVPIGNGRTLFLRVECGGQPSLDTREGRAHAVLTPVFKTRL